ncbi:hypothetical protein WK18_06940 [Burkholderia ubonensis]|nr:hypothetical protein WK18_06940 [Burkholderia ubonensis]KWB73202.1 hypothetical protein WL41_18935 [Burkholderia ubonensis]KWC11203.1 hypothetical protein WL46_07885 [Burkholderia ubonensis]
MQGLLIVGILAFASSSVAILCCMIRPDQDMGRVLKDFLKRLAKTFQPFPKSDFPKILVWVIASLLIGPHHDVPSQFGISSPVDIGVDELLIMQGSELSHQGSDIIVGRRT